jgi:hypothetical protein
MSGDDLRGDQGLFTNIQSSYWSGTDKQFDAAWYFRPVDGGQHIFTKSNGTLHAWAVRAGDVTAAPLPGTAVLMALGLFGLVAGRQKRRAT